MTPDKILDAAIGVFGKFGLKKTTVNDLARASGLSKQGLYLHFSGKEEIFVKSIERYLQSCLEEVSDALASENELSDRIAKAIESWFGRHKEVFSQDALDVVVLGNHLTRAVSDGYSVEFKRRMALAIVDDPASCFTKREAKEIADVLFVCGLSWKELDQDKPAFSKSMKLCVKVCLQRGKLN